MTGLVSCYDTLGTALAPNQANDVEFPLTATAPTAAGPVINYASVAEDGTSDTPTPDASCIGCGSSAAAVVSAPPPTPTPKPSLLARMERKLAKFASLV